MHVSHACMVKRILSITTLVGSFLAPQLMSTKSNYNYQIRVVKLLKGVLT